MEGKVPHFMRLLDLSLDTVFRRVRFVDTPPGDQG